MSNSWYATPIEELLALCDENKVEKRASKLTLPPMRISVRESPMPKKSPYSMVFVTAPSRDVANALASGLVTTKLASCCNIISGTVSPQFYIICV